MGRDRIQLWVCLKKSGTVKRVERLSDSYNKLTQNISSLTNAFRPTNYHGHSNNGVSLNCNRLPHFRPILGFFRQRNNKE